jgi:uncharacterized protein (TIGR02145 family)
MQRLTTLLLLAGITFITQAQTDCGLPHDINNNGSVDIEDFLSILGLFGDQDSDGDGLYDSQDECIDLLSCNFLDHDAEFCTYPSANGDCSIDCPFDSDGDGICDVDCGVTKNYQGYDYQTVQIGGQCWFAENLRNQNYTNGDDILSGAYGASFGSQYTGPDNLEEGFYLDSEYGLLYDGYAKSDVRGLCPSGWHIPTNDDWDVLANFLGGEELAGVKLKSTTGWDNDGNGTNESGFSANPAGYYDYPCCWWQGVEWGPGGTFVNEYGGNLEGAGQHGLWWSNYGPGRELRSGTNALLVTGDGDAKSIRCLRNRGCTNPNACNYDGGEDTVSDETTCIFPEVCDTCSGETDGSGTIVDNDTDNDGVCNEDEVLGCTNPDACNYDDLATDDDGSCDLSCAPEYPGCGNPVMYKGYEYPTVSIGNQCWFSENLRTEYYVNGDSIRNDLNYYQLWGDSIGTALTYSSTYSYYDPPIDVSDQQLSLSTFGRYYNWYAVNDSRKLCPKGWHVPTMEEWAELADDLGGEDVAGQDMKTPYYWYEEGNGTNSSGFSGLPGGGLTEWEGFQYAGVYGYWWSSSSSGVNENGDPESYGRRLSYSSDALVQQGRNPHEALSVRCILGETGCTDINACNYDAFPSTVTDNSTCIYPDGICESCSGETDGNGVIVDNDSDDDGVCNADEVLGCVHDWGCNYDPMATEDDGSCDPSCAPEVVGCGNLSYQGYDYEVVKIGSQCWFAENLRSEQFENGDPISFNTNEGGDGLLYTWYAVDDARGLCPSGWNVPSGADWSQLKNHLGGYNVAGEKMKSTDGWLNGGNGTNTSGFNALPSGYQGSWSNFLPGTFTEFWQSNRYDECAYYENSDPCWSGVYHYLTSASDRLNNEVYGGLGSHRSIRCMKETGDEGSGCTDPSACNYDSTPTLVINNDFCVYAQSDCESCSGEVDGTGTVVYNDFNGDGVCLIGCTDSWACNFNEAAETDDGSCEYDSCESNPCGDPLNYQGYQYETVLIGEQCWFAENLRSEQYTNGQPIANHLVDYWWTTATFGAVGVYGVGDDCNDYSDFINYCDPTESLQAFGRYYNWYAVDDARGLCPSGWHVPSVYEWDEMIDFLGGPALASIALKSDGNMWPWSGGSNSSGFTALPGGFLCMSCGPGWHYAGDYGAWWTSTPGVTQNPDYIPPSYARSLSSYSYDITASEPITAALSVRCLQDSE